MVEVATLDLRARTDGLKQAEAALNEVTRAAVRTEDAAKDAGLAVSNAGRSMGIAGGNTRMFAQQLSQVAQQGAATGQWAQAFSIQAADIGMAFGAMGAAAGVAITVLGPLAASFLTSSEAGLTLEEQMDELTSATDDFRSALANLEAPADSIAEKYGVMANAALGLSEAMVEVARVAALEELRAAADAIAAPLTGLVSQITDDTGVIGEDLSFLADSLGVSASEAQGLLAAITALEGAQGPEAIAQAGARLADQLLRANGSYEDMNAQSRALYSSAINVADEAAQIAAMSDRAADAMEPMPGILSSAAGAASAAAAAVGNIGSAASGALGSMQALAAAAWDYAGALGAAMGASSNNYQRVVENGGVDAIARAGNAATFGRAIPRLIGVGNPNFRGAGAGGGGGGGGASDSFQASLDSLVQDLQTERETIDAWYQEGQELLADRRAMELLGEQEHREAILALEAEYQSRLAGLKEEGQGGILASTADYFGQLYSLSNQSLGKLGQLQRVAAQGQLVVDQVKALSAVWGDASIPWFAKGLAIAKVVAAFAGLRSTLGGGGGGARGGGNIGAATTPPALPDRTIRVNIEGDGMFAEALRGATQQIANALFEEREIGGVVVT